MCGYCTTLKRELARREVPFEDVNIFTNREAAETVRAANGGDELVPTVRVGETFLPNPSVEEVLAVLEE
ncbi:NrdH-redoxin [Egibacter rhizosphaerae]|uniref:NrdH-redoxin n=2 Tax=Egibacter rhizosphaerae TaxID=1670831 RepID=A0A411YKX0_9ACTN|nr:NrdH-redoxin [Egibacter rhizosphaerae]